MILRSKRTDKILPQDIVARNRYYLIAAVWPYLDLKRR